MPSSLAFVEMNDAEVSAKNPALLQFVSSLQKSGDNVFLYSTMSDDTKKILTGKIGADLEKLKMTQGDKAYAAEQAKIALGKKLEEFKASDAVKALTGRGVGIDGAVDLSQEPGAAVAAKVQAKPDITRVYVTSCFDNKPVAVGQKTDENIANHLNAEIITYMPGKDAKTASPRKILFVVQEDDIGTGHNGLALGFLKETLGQGDEVVVWVAIQDETKKAALTGNVFKDLKRAVKGDEIKSAVDAATKQVQDHIAEFQQSSTAKELAALGATIKFDFETAPKRREAAAAKIVALNPDRVFVIRKDKVGVEIKDDMDDFILGNQFTSGKYDVVLYRASRAAREAARQS